MPVVLKDDWVNFIPRTLMIAALSSAFLGLNGSRNGFFRPSAPPKHSRSLLQRCFLRTRFVVKFVVHHAQPYCSLQSSSVRWWEHWVLMHWLRSSGCTGRGGRGATGGEGCAHNGMSLQENREEQKGQKLLSWLVIGYGQGVIPSPLKFSYQSWCVIKQEPTRRTQGQENTSHE